MNIFSKLFKSKNSNKPKEPQTIYAYLVSATMLTQHSDMTANTRLTAQLFIMGIVDAHRQVTKISWNEFIAIYEDTLKNHDLLPEIPVEKFVEIITSKVSTVGQIQEIMGQGARSIGRYIGKQDSQAPFDFSVALLSPIDSSLIYS